jgi:hypothetical protein
VGHANRRRLSSIALLSAATGFALSTAVLISSANAQTAYCWIDAATGRQVTSLVPIGVTQEELYRLQVRGGDINHANGGGGRTYFRQPDGSWIDAATGQQVTSLIPIGVTQEELHRLQVRGGDINHANGGGGRTYVLVPCPPPAQPVQAAPSPLVPLLPNVGIGIGIGIGHGEDRPDHH